MALAHQTDKFRAMQANPGLMAEKLADLHRTPVLRFKERGLLMQPDLALKTHRGEKTNTRRLCKVAAPDGATSAAVITSLNKHNGEWNWMSGDPRDADTWTILGDEFRCPYGVPGDRLWIREHWRVHRDADRFKPSHLPRAFRVHYEADGEAPDQEWGKFRPGMFLPRWACRTVVEITQVWLERLHEISDADALAEGVDRTNTSIPGYAVQRYRDLWQRINGAESWAANPWVWSLHFEKIKA